VQENVHKVSHFSIDSVLCCYAARLFARNSVDGRMHEVMDEHDFLASSFRDDTATIPRRYRDDDDMHFGDSPHLSFFLLFPFYSLEISSASSARRRSLLLSFSSRRCAFSSASLSLSLFPSPFLFCKSLSFAYTSTGCVPC